MLNLGDGKPKPAGTWDFWGSELFILSWETVSVGVFQWVPKSSGKGTKKSVVVKRLRDSDRNRLIQDAVECCEVLGETIGNSIVDPKLIKVTFSKEGNGFEVVRL